MVSVYRLQDFLHDRHAVKGRTGALSIKFQGLGQAINVRSFSGHSVPMVTIHTRLT